MGGTRIIVLQMREIIRTAVFALIGLAVILLLVYLFIPRNKPEVRSSADDPYIPGTYKAEIILHNNPVDVDVTVSKDKILNVSMTSLAETQEVFYPLFSPAMEQLSKDVVRNQGTDVELSADYPVTGQILLDAVSAALEQAANREYKEQ